MILSLAIAAGFLVQSWAFPLSLDWLRDRPSWLRSWRAHVAVVVVSVIGLGIAQQLGHAIEPGPSTGQLSSARGGR